MPAFLTHKIAADNVQRAISDPELRRLIESAPAAYQSGAQGGDYFYSYKYYSMWAGHTYKMFGWALHRARVKRFFLEGARHIKEHPSDTVKAYFLGYITHYALDMYVHPLVVELGPEAMSTHNLVECALDCMYALRNDVDPWEFDKAQFIHDTLVTDGRIDEFLSAMMNRLYYGFTLPEHPYTTAYTYFEGFHRMLQKSGRSARLTMDLRDLFTILKTRTLVYRPYDEIKDAYDYDRLFSLVDSAVGHAVRWIEAVGRYWRDEADESILEELFYNINMMGVPITPIEERKPFRKLYKKAPLVHVPARKDHR